MIKSYHKSRSEDITMSTKANISETNTENVFRTFYGANTFIEKSAIPKEYGFVSKKKDHQTMDIQIFLKIKKITV